jgi:hypothetical protein
VRIKDLGNRPAPASIRELLSRVVRGRGPSFKVQRRQVPYWQERGWTRNGNAYTGTYQTRYGAFCGEIVEHSASDIEFFLYMPSDEIRRHSHWACFQHRGNDWYLVHMGRRPKDASSGILTIERLLTEAFES